MSQALKACNYAGTSLKQRGPGITVMFSSIPTYSFFRNAHSLHQLGLFLSLTRTVDKIEPEGVSAVVVDDDQRIWIILFALTHLLTV